MATFCVGVGAVKELVFMFNRLHIFHGGSDVWQWNSNTSKQYTVKSGYEGLLAGLNLGKASNPDWACAMWKFAQNIIPLLPNLKSRGILFTEAQIKCRICDALVPSFFQLQFG